MLRFPFFSVADICLPAKQPVPVSSDCKEAASTGMSFIIFHQIRLKTVLPIY